MILIVKSPSARTIAAAAALAGLLAGCGQPGPLYMPKPPAKPAQQSTPASAPAPAPAPTAS